MRKLSINGIHVVLTEDGEMYLEGESPLTARPALDVGLEGGDAQHTVDGLMHAAETAIAELDSLGSKATKWEMREAIEAALQELRSAVDACEGWEEDAAQLIEVVEWTP